MSKTRPVTRSSSKNGPSTGLRKAMVPLLVAAVAGIIAIMSISGGSNNENSAQAQGDQAENGSLPRFDYPGPRPRGATGMAIGAADAPIVMIMYSEYQCPYCGRHANQTQPQILESYVNSGVLRIEWRDFPFLGDESFAAAAAARAAGDQNAYWEYSNRLFIEQDKPNSGHLNDEYLLRVAAELGLDTDRFAQVMNDPATAAAVTVDRDEGITYGVTGTPAFFVNGRFISGSQPAEVFAAAIEDAATAAGITLS